MALKRKTLLLDAEHLAALAARRGTTESATVREVVANALFAEEFVEAMEKLRTTGYGAVSPEAAAQDARD